VLRACAVRRETPPCERGQVGVAVQAAGQGRGRHEVGGGGGGATGASRLPRRVLLPLCSRPFTGIAVCRLCRGLCPPRRLYSFLAVPSAAAAPPLAFRSFAADQWDRVRTGPALRGPRAYGRGGCQRSHAMCAVVPMRSARRHTPLRVIACANVCVVYLTCKVGLSRLDLKALQCVGPFCGVVHHACDIESPDGQTPVLRSATRPKPNTMTTHAATRYRRTTVSRLAFYINQIHQHQ
jgi:hypothetical protein